MGSSFPITTGILGDYLNRSPDEYDYALIGKIALLDTALEYQFERLIWYYMEDVDKGHIATARLRTRDRIEMLKTFVEWIEPDDGVANALLWALKCFDTLRENRNDIIHGFNFRADKRANKLVIEKRTKNLVFTDFHVLEINRDILERVCADQRALGMFLWRLDQVIEERPKGSIGPNRPPPDEFAQLPARHAPPESLRSLPHETPKSARRQRQELAAKEAKLARKVRQREKKPKE